MNSFAKLLLSLCFMSLLSACCVFSTEHCECDPPKPYVNKNAVDWIPLDSADVYYNSDDSIPQTKRLFANYAHRKEYVGGEECGAEFEAFSNEFEFKTKDQLMCSKALMDRVDFYLFSAIGQKTINVSAYNADNDQFSNEGYFEITRSDSLTSTGKIPRVMFRKLNSGDNSIPFLKLTFMKGRGVVNYTDNDGVVWHRQ